MADNDNSKNSKKRQLDLLEEVYNEEKETLYLGTNVVNIKKAQDREEEIFALHEYIPNLLRSFLSLDYYTVLREADVLDKVLKQMAKTRKQGREADVIEFINWVDNHKEFKDLLNEKRVKELGDKLEQLEKEYDLVRQAIKKNG